jgi:hypothetical protein
MPLDRRRLRSEAAQTEPMLRLVAILTETGITNHEIANALNLKWRTVCNRLSRGFARGKGTRTEMEDLLGVPIWSTREQFKERDCARQAIRRKMARLRKIREKSSVARQSQFGRRERVGHKQTEKTDERSISMGPP